MSELQSLLEVTVLGRQYQFKVPQGKQAEFETLAKTLDENVTALQTQSPLTSRDQLLVVSALNTLLQLHELQQRCLTETETLQNLVSQVQTTLTT